jgi:hypothetical protein
MASRYISAAYRRSLESIFLACHGSQGEARALSGVSGTTPSIWPITLQLGANTLLMTSSRDRGRHSGSPPRSNGGKIRLRKRRKAEPLVLAQNIDQADDCCFVGENAGDVDAPRLRFLLYARKSRLAPPKGLPDIRLFALYRLQRAHITRAPRASHSNDDPEGPSLIACFFRINLERAKGFEPSTPTLARLCSTTELHPHP